jgi:hypothetical protein
MMNRGTGFIALTLAGHLPARVGLPPRQCGRIGLIDVSLFTPCDERTHVIMDERWRP